MFLSPIVPVHIFKDESVKDRPILHVDMDNVIFNYTKRWLEVKSEQPDLQWPQSIKGFFASLEPIDGAVDAVKQLQTKYDLWILTRASPKNGHSYSEKWESITKYFGPEMCERLFIAPTKSLVIGDYLIDDHIHLGFKGEHVHFGSEKFPDWKSVLSYLM